MALDIALLSAGLGLSLATGAISTVSSIQMGERNREAAERNAQAALDARRRNRALEEEELRDRVSRMIALTSASGISFSGSPLSVTREMIGRYREEQNIRDYEAAAGAARIRNAGRLAQQEGLIGGVETGLGTLTSGLQQGLNIYDRL